MGHAKGRKNRNLRLKRRKREMLRLAAKAAAKTPAAKA